MSADLTRMLWRGYKVVAILTAKTAIATEGLRAKLILSEPKDPGCEQLHSLDILQILLEREEWGIKLFHHSHAAEICRQTA